MSFERSGYALLIYEVYNEVMTSPAKETRFENSALERQIDQVDQFFLGRCLEGNHAVGLRNLWRSVCFGFRKVAKISLESLYIWQNFSVYIIKKFSAEQNL